MFHRTPLPRVLRSALFAAFAVTTVVPSIATAAAGSVATLAGTVAYTVSDDFQAGRSVREISLDTAGGIVPLSGVESADLPAGSGVQVTGRWAGSGFDATGTSFVDLTTPTLLSPTAPTRKVAVIIAEYSDLPGDPATPAQATSIFAGASGSVADLYHQASRGTVSLNVSVFGPWALGIPQCPENTNFDRTFSALPAVASSHGVDLSTFDHIVVWTKAPCGSTAGGWGRVTGRYVQIFMDSANGASQNWPMQPVEVAAHELGHNLGLEHANGLACFDATGQQVTLGLPTECEDDPYDDPFSTMGAAAMRMVPGNLLWFNQLFSSEDLRKLGWLAPAETTVVTSPGTYSIVPVYSPAAGVRELRIRRPAPVMNSDPWWLPAPMTGGYWTLEIRSAPAASVFDQFPASYEVANGVSIRYAEDPNATYGVTGATYILDTVPTATRSAGTSPVRDFWDAPLAPGKTFVDTVAGFRITVNSASSSGATVSITTAAPGAPDAPIDVHALTRSGSATVMWSPPYYDGGSPITKYTVTSSPGGKSCTTTGGLSCLVTGLMNATAYTFRVSATNANGTGPWSAASSAVTPSSVVRYSGDSRFATAAQISLNTFPDPSAVDVAYIAYAYNFPDALAAAAAAGTVHGPVLLVDWNIPVNSSTAGELQRLKPKTIVVLGGTSVVPSYVVDALKKYSANVVRYAGASRFETAAQISAHTFTDPSKVDAVYIAYAYNFPDALAGAAAAGTLHGPVLLANSSGALDASTVAELQRLQPKQIVVLGGSSAIGDSVFNALKGYSQNVVRYAGTSRFGTAARISASVFTDPATVDVVYIAYAYNFPDALAGAAAAGTLRGPVLLANSSGPLDPDTIAELQRLHPKEIVVLGGTSAIDASVFEALKVYPA